MDFYVYLHRKATTGEIFYVGKGTGDRAWQSSSGRRGLHWNSVAAKYGFTVEIAAAGLQEWYAHELERELIALYGRRDLGLGPLINLTDGGEGGSGRKLSKEAAERHAAKVRAVTATTEWRKRHAASVKARSASPEWKEKNLVGARKRSENPSWREKLKAPAISRSADPAYRSKLSSALLKASADPEWRRKNTGKNRLLRAKPVVCIETGRVFEAGADALEWLRSIGHQKASSPTLSAACKGRKKSAYGHTWRYA